MNFKDWKKIAEDEKTVTLEHPKGHSMRIAIGSIPKIQREQLKRLELAEGGKVGSGKQRSDNERGVNRQSSAPKGGESLAGHWVRTDDKDMAKASHKITRMEQRLSPSPKIKGLKDGGDPADAPEMPMADDAQSEQPQQQPTTSHGNVTIINNPAPVAQAPPPPQPDPNTPHASQDYQAPLVPSNLQNANVDTGVANPSAPQFKTNLHKSGTIDLKAMNQNTEALAKKEMEIQAAKEQTGAKAEDQYLNEEQHLLDRSNTALKLFKGRTDDFNSYQRQNADAISPKHFGQTQSDAGKVMTAIGLFFGGMSVPFGGHNFAMDFLNKQIDRDIDAQKQRAEQEKNIYGAYKDLYHDDVLATSAAKIANLDILQHNMARRAHELGTAEAATKLQQGTQDILLNRQGEMQKVFFRLHQLDKEGNLPPSLGGAGSSQKEEKQPEGIYNILSPNAEDAYQGARNDPQLSSIWDKDLRNDYERADQLERVLNGPKKDGKDGLHEIFKNMQGYANASGIYGHTMREGSAAIDAIGSMVPGAGPGLGHAVGIIPKTDNQKLYNAEKEKLISYIGAALGDKVGVNNVRQMVDESAPAYKDDDKMTAAKEKIFANKLITTVPMLNLRRARMVK